MTARYGATPDDWCTFDLLLGLTEDLLPVVSNPTAAISPDSVMKGLGKTPSRYNANRQAVGFAKWTEFRATGDDVERWSGQPDYGICIQTRNIRALDIDVDDPVKAQAIAERFCNVLGTDLPARVRANSGKMLLAFRMAGEFPKRSFKVDGGLVEFLGNGQQFIAIGTHPSGARYEWRGGLPSAFPEVKNELF